MNGSSFFTTRRRFIKIASVVGGTLAFGSTHLLAEGKSRTVNNMAPSALPAGAAPEPLQFPHFPDRLHAFVWRNWSLVSAERMAKVVGATKTDIIQIGQSMGLGQPPKITREQILRSYITVIKRNWHLLPYEQLLELLDWTPQELDYTLREDDFLFIKLGSLKPHCSPLRFEPPNHAVHECEKEIATLVHKEFPTNPQEHSEPLFSFVSQLSHSPKHKHTVLPSSQLKFCYSYFALYGDPLLATDTDPYPDGYLERLAQSGVNGIWLQAVLSKLTPFPWAPSTSDKYETRLKNLHSLVTRAKRHGVKVFLYLNEPRSMPLDFFKGHPEFKGTVEGDRAVLCTSVPEVQQYLTNAIASVCKAVPDLGGFFSITASENLTNCWSHGQGKTCPRCSKRSPAEVIAEVNSLFQAGIKKSGTSAQLIAWDWGWDNSWALDAIQKLPEGVCFMSVSEWDMPFERGGIKSSVGEYSISVVGPGPRATRHWAAAHKHGLKTIAKIQAGNTWELSSVPYIPAMENVARHAENLSRAQVDGIMLGWTLGGYPSPNLEVVAETLACKSAAKAMQTVARRRFGPTLSPAILTAWQQFSTAFCEFPYHGGLLYSGPQHMGPANLLYSEPTGYHASMVGFPYDDLDAWRAIYPPEVFIKQFDAVASGFKSALDQLKASTITLLPDCSSEEKRAFESEYRVAEAAWIHFRSSANQGRFILERRALESAKTRADAIPHIDALQNVIQDEIELAHRLHEIQTCDSRIGFEASNHYFYVPMDLAEKILNCHYLLDHWLPQAGPKA